ncbi:TerC family protein [Gorillibacterium sp. sgz5001074]|uniref:TerC family protein n=1 Tax=Gorillibacterium sp. sgz5001074 TaxID=3446695 RepID=UPI003F66E8BF
MLKEEIGMDFIVSLLSIIAIDLVLAGDNAIVIGMASRNLPVHQQKRAILLGTAGAIVIRALSTLVVVWLLGLAGLKLLGGCLLVWIAYKLLADKDGGHGQVNAGMSLMKAVGTIVVADTVMGLDNVLAVAGAAHGDFVLVVVGLLISIPIMVFGSTLVIRMMARYPWLIYLGAGVLAWTAGKMITGESFVYEVLSGAPALKWVIDAAVIAGVLYAGYRSSRRRSGVHGAQLVQADEQETQSATA